jgi:hypothetical protein
MRTGATASIRHPLWLVVVPKPHADTAQPSFRERHVRGRQGPRDLVWSVHQARGADSYALGVVLALAGGLS